MGAKNLLILLIMILAKIISMGELDKKIKHFNIRIFGLVQGVNFRALGKERADKLSVKGFIKNKSDGAVYIEAEGSESALTRFIKWCEHGPKGADVINVKIKEGELKNYKDFMINY